MLMGLEERWNSLTAALHQEHKSHTGQVCNNFFLPCKLMRLVDRPELALPAPEELWACTDSGLAPDSTSHSSDQLRADKRNSCVPAKRRQRDSLLPAVPGVASVLLSSPVVFTEEMIKAQDSHNLTLGGAACYSIFLHCHWQSRKPIKPGTNPICVFYSCTQYVSA